MPSTTPPSESLRLVDFSLTRGGPLHRLLRKLGLIRLDRSDVWRQSVAFGLVGWMPLQATSLLNAPSVVGLESVLQHDVALHARYWIALPLFFFAEQVLEQRCRSAIGCVRTGDGAYDAREGVANAARAAERLRDSALAEFLLLASTLAVHVVLWRYTDRVALLSDSETKRSMFGMFWTGVVSLPLFNFVLLRWLWRWLIWAQLLWRLSHLRLALIATHPDHAGGIARLAEPTYAIAVLFVGIDSVIAVSWCMDVIITKAVLASFLLQFSVMVSAGLLVAFGPLTPFVGALVRARFEGGAQYNEFAYEFTRTFHRRWIEGLDRDDRVAPPNVSELADLIASVESVHQMRVTPFGREALLVVLSSLVIPMLPLPLVASPLPVQELLRRVLGTVLLGA